MEKGELMDINNVILSGRVTKVRHCTIKDKFAYLNINISELPVLINLVGNKYNQKLAEDITEFFKGDAYIAVNSAILDSSKGDRPIKQIVIKNDFSLSVDPLPEFSIAAVRGKILNYELQEGNVIATIGASYYSKKPGESKGEYKNRLVKAKLEKNYTDNIVGAFMSTHGSLYLNGNDVYLNSYLSIIENA